MRFPLDLSGVLLAVALVGVSAAAIERNPASPHKGVAILRQRSGKRAFFTPHGDHERECAMAKGSVDLSHR